MNRKLFLILFTAVIFPLMVSSCEKEKETSVETVNSELIIMEFGSTCVPCAKMKIILDLLVEEHGDKVAVEYIDIGSDEGKARAGDYNIRIIPSQIFLDSEGAEIFRHDGYLPREELLSLLEKLEIVR